MQRHWIRSHAADAEGVRSRVVSNAKGNVRAKGDLCTWLDMVYKKSANGAYRTDLHPVDAVDLPNDKIVAGRQENTRLPSLDRQRRTGSDIL